MFKMMFFGDNVTRDLMISGIETRTDGKFLEILGCITNSSGREWSNVTVEAEFFDESGKFVDEYSVPLTCYIRGHSQESFKMVVRTGREDVISGSIKPIVKVSGGISDPF
jgi:hypothetical protein